MRQVRISWLLVVSTATSCACGSAGRARPITSAPIDRALAITRVDVDAALLSACEIAEAPPFKLDSAAAGTTPDKGLKTLAHCLSSGSREYRKVHLVGHDDPRHRFVAVFGKSRMEAVRDFLIFHGVERGAIEFRLADAADDGGERRVVLRFVP